MFNFSFLLAEAAAEEPSLLGSLPMILILVAIVPMFLFSFLRQKKQQRKENELRDSLQIGDEVTTIGGIIGKVVSVKGETFVLETTKDKTKIRFLKTSIRSVDVKAADIAASVMEVNSTAAPAEAKTADKTDAPEKKSKKEKKAKKAEDVAEAQPDTTENA